MKTIALMVLACTGLLIAANGRITIDSKNNDKEVVLLPEPALRGKMSLEEALANRRSRRDFENKALTLKQLGQLLWAGQGRTDSSGLRTAPSAGALYPIELYVVVENVRGLAPGVYRYEMGETARKVGISVGISLPRNIRPRVHYESKEVSYSLRKIKDGKLLESLQQACLGQSVVAAAPVCIVVAADYARTSKKYESRAPRYVHMEAGHIGQNIYLQAESLGLGTCAVGAFSDSEVKSLLSIREDPLCVMPVGVPADKDTP